MSQPGLLFKLNIFAHENIPDRHEISDQVNECGGAFSYTLEDPGVTHCLVDNSISPRELTKITKHCADNNKYLASIHWLYACIREDEVVSTYSYPPQYDPQYTLPAATEPFEPRSSESSGGSGAPARSIRRKSTTDDFRELMDARRNGTPISDEQRKSVLDETGELLKPSTSATPPRNRRRSTRSRSQSPNNFSFDSDVTDSFSTTDDSEISFG